MTNRIQKVARVSVCVVTYNQKQYIRRCLQSIVDQETEFEFEVIVGDDCSTDGTRAIVQEFAEKYPDMVRAVLHNQNLGPTINYQSVHGLAKAELVCHCDGDDYWLPTKLQVQVAFMEQNPLCNVSGHRMYVAGAEGDSLAHDYRGNLPEVMDISAFYEYGNFLPHSSTMYRASCGPVPEVTGETIDFLTHIWRVRDGRIGFINAYLGVYRAHEASVTARLRESLIHFHLNLTALEEIHKIVKDPDEFERRKFVLCKDCIKNLIVNGRVPLAKEIAVKSRSFISKKRHWALLTLMVLFSDFIGLALRAKRKYL